MVENLESRVRVEYYVNENTFKERLQLYFIKNQRSSFRIRIADLVFKLLTCVLYILRVVFDDDPINAACYGCTPPNKTEFLVSYNLSEEAFQENPIINWDAIVWVERPAVLWVVQVILAGIGLAEALLLVYLGYKGNIWQQLLSFHFILKLVITIPFAFTIVYPPFRNLFIPVFLNCWLAKRSLEKVFNDRHRAMTRSHSALSQQLIIVSATLLCLVFTSVCGIQHCQRAGHRHLDLVQSTYYVVVTFSTVGYGDLVPDIWPSQIYMVVMICVALVVLPTEFEQLAFTWMERRRWGGSYSAKRAQSEKHVVVYTPTLHAGTIMDFLNEFYAHPQLQDYSVVLLSPVELDTTMRVILQIPIWAQRVIYISGSCLGDVDLERVRMNEAEACFVLADRNYAYKDAADEHTILSSWAVKDFAPCVPQYVQIFRPENKLHVKFAEHVVCEDELKYALLANNCMFPGAFTLVTLLLHTSRGQEGQTSSEEWHRLYGRCSGNEIYHILLEDSRFFGEYEGKSFTYASFHSHRKYGVALVGVRPAELPGFHEDTTLLNPGPRHILKNTDTCFYMSITKEENSAVIANNANQDANTEADGSRIPNILPVPDTMTCSSLIINLGPHDDGDESEDKMEDNGDESEDKLEDDVPCRSPSKKIAIVKRFPPESPYIGVSPTLCHLLKEKKPLCCLQLAQVCEHCTHRNAQEYNWQNKTIILVSDYASNGMYNFIVPLRAHFRTKTSLNPIILLLERRPDIAFLDAVACFPLVYWMLGSIDCLDDLLKAGITQAENVVVVNKELSDSSDRNTDQMLVVAVQTMSKFFPSIKSITELSLSSKMRFIQFRAHDRNALHLSKIAKVLGMELPYKAAPALYDNHDLREKERGSHISYMFRLPFAAGSVFSAGMLDTLLYQAFVKDYVITLVRLLLGVDQAPGSGFLTSMKITKDDMWIRTYGRLYQKLCSTTCEVPIGIYRTQDTTTASSPHTEPEVGNTGSAYSAVPVNYLSSTESDSASMYSINVGDEAKDNHAEMKERAEIVKLVKSRMKRLSIPSIDYEDVSEKRSSLAYVIINPGCDLKLEEGDIIYLVRPSPFSTHTVAQKAFERHNSRSTE